MTSSNRKPIVAGNWKMNLKREQAQELARKVAQSASEHKHVTLVLIPPSCYLDVVAQAVQGTPVSVGAQNFHPESDGAFTGEIAGPMLRDLNVKYVVCGHSERRHLFGETSAWIGTKVLAAHEHALIPILCVGETLDERQMGHTEKVVLDQLRQGLSHLSADQVSRTVLAYEPVWAIGTGHTATPAQAQEVHVAIRREIDMGFGTSVASAIRILYGGSVKSTNAGDLMPQADIDGGLVGGASLTSDSFMAIVGAMQ